MKKRPARKRDASWLDVGVPEMLCLAWLNDSTDKNTCQCLKEHDLHKTAILLKRIQKPYSKRLKVRNFIVWLTKHEILI
jgi:hypothetical protein